MSDARLMTLRTALGEALVFRSMVADESLGRPFHITVTAFSEQEDLDPDAVLGAPAHVSLELPDDTRRHFDGIVVAFEQTGQTERFFEYRLTLAPWLWLLKRRRNSKIFQNMSVPDIVKAVLGDYSGASLFDLTKRYPPREYCVQYRESDFDFVSRLMEQEGIYYFVQHDDTRHTIKFVDAMSSHTAFPGFETVRYRESVEGQTDLEAITRWETRRRIRSGRALVRDFDFKKPSTLLEQSEQAARGHGEADAELYDYPGGFEDQALGQARASAWLGEQQAVHDRASGESNVRGLVVGHRFTLEDTPRADQQRDHVVVSTRIRMGFKRFEAQGELTYFECAFEAIAGDETFRSQRSTPLPTVRGPQTAMVVGEAGSEITTDLYGRVKIQFHWDRIGKRDQNSSCWVRVATPWASAGFGMIALPRIGDEVVVDFLEGDPDRPLITGRVYNANTMPPYPLPDHATVSTIKSRSSKGGGTANYNELRFEDKKDSEQVWLQAEKDMHRLVKNDAFDKIGRDDHQTVVRDRVQSIGRDHFTTIERDEKHELGGDLHSHVTGDSLHKVDGLHSLKVGKDITAESGMTISQKAGMDMQVKVGKNYALSSGMAATFKAGMNIVLEAGMQITIKAGPSSVVLGPDGVSITGPLVKINSGGGGGSASDASPVAPTPPQAPTAAVEPKDPLPSR